jgi:hypothetical protein
VNVGTGLVVADWIKQLADDERKRDAVRAREEETAARKADLIRVHGRRLLEELRATVTRDIEAFREEFAGDRVRTIVFEDTQPEGGFVVRKPEFPAVSLTVAPHLEAAAVGCHYRFTASNGLPPREDRFELVFIGDEMETLQVKHHGNGRVFATAEALSEFLLAPVFVGRPR